MIDPVKLYNLVKDLPQKYWPDGIRFEILGLSTGDSEEEESDEDFPTWLMEMDGVDISSVDDDDEVVEEVSDPSIFLPTQYAERMFCDAITEALMDASTTLTMLRSDKQQFSVNNGKWYDTRLEALVGAAV